MLLFDRAQADSVKITRRLAERLASHRSDRPLP
jgi:hypothetical protein